MNASAQSMYRLCTVLALALAFCALAVPAAAQEAEAPAGEMSAEEAAMMEAWQKSMALGPQHEMMAQGVGSWKFTGRFWMNPDEEPTVSEGTVENSLELGGRVMVEKVTSTMMGMPFEGIGRTGYDNVTGKWWSTWTDNMSTGLMTMTGSYDEATQTHTYEGEMADAMTGQMRPMKMVVRYESHDRHVAEMFAPGPDGSMIRTMELVYERQE